MPQKKEPLWHRLGRRYGGDVPLPMQKGKFGFIFLLCLPAVFGLLVWYFGVNFQSIAMAFQDPVTEEFSLVNFQRLFVELSDKNSAIYIGLINTFKYFILGAIIIPTITYVIAFYLYRRIKFSNFFLIMLHIPNIVSGVVIAAMFKNLLSPLGPLSTVMNEMGLGLMPSLFADKETATKTLLAIVFILGMDTNILLWIGTFKRVPNEVMESAMLDGATEGQIFLRIVTPMVATTISTLLILGCTTIFMASGPILLYTNGNADTTTLNFWIFQQTYTNQEPNYPAAVGIFFTFIGVPLVLFLNWLSGKITKAVEY